MRNCPVKHEVDPHCPPRDRHGAKNFRIKRRWKGKSRIDDIEAGLVDLVRVIEDKQALSMEKRQSSPTGRITDKNQSPVSLSRRT